MLTHTPFLATWKVVPLPSLPLAVTLGPGNTFQAPGLFAILGLRTIAFADCYLTVPPRHLPRIRNNVSISRFYFFLFRLLMTLIARLVDEHYSPRSRILPIIG